MKMVKYLFCSGFLFILTRLNLEFYVRSITHLPLNGFSLNFGQKVHLGAETMTQLCQLKVKVTVEGHEFEPLILYPLL